MYTSIYGCDLYPGIYVEGQNENITMGEQREDLGGLRMYICLEASKAPLAAL